MSHFNGKPTKDHWRTIRNGCGGEYLHESGAIVRHCGHPTANWPYYGEIARNGIITMIVSHNGRAFRHLPDAQYAVELALVGREFCTTCFNRHDGCSTCNGTGSVKKVAAHPPDRPDQQSSHPAAART